MFGEKHGHGPDNASTAALTPLAPVTRSSPAADVSFSALSETRRSSRVSHGLDSHEQATSASSPTASRSSSKRRGDSSHGRGFVQRLRSDKRQTLETTEDDQDTSFSRTSRHGENSSKGKSSPRGSPHIPKKTGGFLLSTVMGSGRLRPSARTLEKGRQTEQSARKGVHSSEERHGHRQSAEYSARQSSLSQATSSTPSSSLKESVPRRHLSHTGMDPAQLVQMALNLSESRKRHVSSTLPVPISPAGGRRVVSGIDSGHGTVKSASSTGKRASYLDDRGNIPSSEPLAHGQLDGARNESPFDPNQNVLYTFSPATLSRAERARRYFELASEHRRLLEYLPSLKFDAKAPGNLHFQTTSSPGSAHYAMTRIASPGSTKQQLGRSYNPLQALRNRRTRNRERRPLAAAPDTFQDIDRTRRWIDGVEAISKGGSSQTGEDPVRLPVFSGELENDASDEIEAIRGHRRTDTVTSVVMRPENGWSVEPAELLADTYWVEKADNKTIVEDRHGNRMFMSRPRASLEVPRRSRDIDRFSDPGNRESQAEDTEDDARHKTNRKHGLPLAGRLRRHPISRSDSVSSVSSNEGRLPPALRFGRDEGGDENVGPLERHMREMIAKDARGELLSPKIASPDLWNARNPSIASSRHSMDRPRKESYVIANGRLSVDMQRPKRSRSVEGRHSTFKDRGVSSMDELVSNGPTSPVVPGFVPFDARDQTKQSSPTQLKNKGLRFPTFRSRSKERNKIEHTDFALSYGSPLSPVPSVGVDKSDDQPRSSVDSIRAPPFRRHRTTDSNASSLGHSTSMDNAPRDGKSSTGLSFLKGSRIGDLVRNEGSRLGERFRGSRERVSSDGPRAHSDASDVEQELQLLRRKTDEDGEHEPRGSLDRERPKSKYFTSNLPEFKWSAARDRKEPQSPVSESGDPFDALTTRAIKSSSDMPKMKLSGEGNGSEPGLASPSTWNDPYQIPYDRLKSVSHDNLTWAADTSAPLPKVRNADTPATGKRHWSISDQARRRQQQESVQLEKTTARDIARVRALLLASAVKAHEICTKADTVRDPPLPLIATAARIANKPLEPRPRKEEYIIAAHLLSSSLDSTISSFEKTLQTFQEETSKSLTHRLETVSQKAADNLTKLVHETSDEADAFNVQLTTKVPQDVKRIEDAIDAMFRQRRRQFRLLRRTGFKVLEWVVLGIMWWVWFVVVVFNMLKKGVVFILMILRWLLWF